MSLIYDEQFKLEQAFNNEMPFVTSDTVKVKYKFGKLPDNFNDVVIKQNEIFLNEWQSKIEQYLPKDRLRKFLNYQNYWIRNEKSSNDSLFNSCKCPTKQQLEKVIVESMLGNNHLPMGMREMSQFPHNTRFSQMIINPHIILSPCDGPDLETTTPHTSPNGVSFDLLQAQKVTGTSGDCYDQIAVDVSTAVGNENLGAYDDNAGDPDNRLEETGSFATVANFNFKSITEFDLATNDTWLAFNHDTNGVDIRQATELSTKRTRVLSFSIPDPFGTATSGDNPFGMKIGHT